MKQLTHLREGKKVAEYLLDVEQVIVGRGTSAGIRLDDNGVVSRQHAVVRRRSGVDQHVVEDLGGANGTFVNGFQVEVHILRPGDRIVLGEDTLRYDFATRNAVSLRPKPPPKEEAEQPYTGSAEFEELSMEAVDVVEDLAEIREEKKAGVISFAEESGERTTVADKDDLERLLALMTIKAKPHLVLVRDGGRAELFALKDPPVKVGHAAGCAIQLSGFKIFGRVAATLVQQAGGWCMVPESPTWTPVLMGEDKLTRIRQLQEGDSFVVAGVALTYHKGEAR
jgi:hypothetical protein